MHAHNSQMGNKDLYFLSLLFSILSLKFKSTWKAWYTCVHVRWCMCVYAHIKKHLLLLASMPPFIPLCSSKSPFHDFFLLNRSLPIPLLSISLFLFLPPKTWLCAKRHCSLTHPPILGISRLLFYVQMVFFVFFLFSFILISRLGMKQFELVALACNWQGIIPKFIVSQSWPSTKVWCFVN